MNYRPEPYLQNKNLKVNASHLGKKQCWQQQQHWAEWAGRQEARPGPQHLVQIACLTLLHMPPMPGGQKNVPAAGVALNKFKRMDMIITDYIDKLIQKAKNQISAGKEFDAVLLHAYKNDTGKNDFRSIPAGPFLKNEVTKKLLIATSHVIAKSNLATYNKQLRCACLIADAYLSVQPMKPEHQNLDTLPRNHGYIMASADPMRREGIMVVTATATTVTLCYHTYERRAWEGVIFTEVVSAGKPQGILVDLFPKKL